MGNGIRKANNTKPKISIRVDKYSELKDLWEKLNEKVILEYEVNNEEDFKDLFIDFLNKENVSLFKNNIRQTTQKMSIEEKTATLKEENSIYDTAKNFKISTMKYSDFLKQVSQELNINIRTIHNSFIKSNININDHLSNGTIRAMRVNFNNFLMRNAMNKFKISYKKVKSSIHPTVFTNGDGAVKKEINSHNIGVLSSSAKVANNYLFNELFYDSEIEKDNITSHIKEVIIFSKIPKNSIKIPIAGGGSYSPDFAYVVDNGNKKKLYFIIESKNTDDKSLRDEENQKIKHAEQFFNGEVKITFKTQFTKNKIIDLIKEIRS